MQAFPEIWYADFCELDDASARAAIVARNRIIQTDTYNRTMAHTNGPLGAKDAEFTMTFRRAPHANIGYPFIVVHGVRVIVAELLKHPITSFEFEFARDYYRDQAQRWGNGLFDSEMWGSLVGKPFPLKVRAVADGTIVQAGDPVLSVHGPAEIASIFEPLYLMSFYDTAVATMGAVIALEVGADRIIDMGLRSTISITASLRASEALYVGGNITMTSNDAAGAVYPWMKNAGTLAHRYMAMYPTQRDAFVHAIEHNERIALLVDLVSSQEGIRIGMELKREYAPKGKSIQFRLDSGDLAAQAISILTLQAASGMCNPQTDYVIVSDISSLEDIRALEATVRDAGFDPKIWLKYGIGWLLVSNNKTRDAMSACFKATEFDGKPVGKLSDDIGKVSLPGCLNIELGTDGSRKIVQTSEPQNGTRLLEALYDHGTLLGEDPRSLASVMNARERVRIALQSKAWQTPSVLSPSTQEAKDSMIQHLQTTYVR